MFSTKDFNPYQPPRFVESVADDELADGGIIVPSWGRVIAYAALASSLLGIALVAVIILANAVFALPLFILMPLSFSWHFSRTYRLPYRCVPKFGWLPWGFALTFAWLMAVVVISWLGLTQSLEFLLSMQIEPGRYLPDAVMASLIIGITCLAMDYVTTFYIPRPSKWRRLLFVPMWISLGSFLPSLAVVFLWRSILLTEFPALRPFPVLNGLLAGCALTVAMFYALIQTHPAIRERILMARSDPRQFAKADFRL